ncbi:MAG: O-antigen ligase family protein [Nitrospinae bacterium]|nr:O-antigen ligase family protein [Nitrospinota bacterium]
MSLFNPFVGLLIYVCFAIISPVSLWGYGLDPDGHYSRIVAIALLIGWVFKGFGGWNFGRGRAIVFAFVAYWLWSIVSAVNAPNDPVAWRFVENTAKILIPFVVGMTLIDSGEKLKKLAWVLVLSLGFVAYEMNLSYYQGFNRIYELGHGGMGNNGVAIGMAVGVGVAFFLGVSESRVWLRGVAWVAALLMIHTVLLAFSRGGMLALVITGFVSFFLLPSKQPKQILALVVVILIALRLAGPQVSDRFMTIFESGQERDVSAQSRLDLWGHAWDVMKEHPLLGVGPDRWPRVASKYGWVEGKEVHSTWLQTGAEMGFPGMALLGAFYALCLGKLWPIVRGKVKVHDPWIQNVGRMVIAGLVGFIIAAQFVTMEGLEVPYYVTLLGAGALRLTPRPAALPRLGKVPALSTAASLFQRRC